MFQGGKFARQDGWPIIAELQFRKCTGSASTAFYHHTHTHTNRFKLSHSLVSSDPDAIDSKKSHFNLVEPHKLTYSCRCFFWGGGDGRGGERREERGEEGKREGGKGRGNEPPNSKSDNQAASSTNSQCQLCVGINFVSLFIPHLHPSRQVGLVPADYRSRKIRDNPFNAFQELLPCVWRQLMKTSPFNLLGKCHDVPVNSNGRIPISCVCPQGP